MGTDRGQGELGVLLAGMSQGLVLAGSAPWIQGFAGWEAGLALSPLEGRECPKTQHCPAPRIPIPWKKLLLGWAKNLLDESSELSGLNFFFSAVFLFYFLFVWSINPLLKLGLPSLCSPLAFRGSKGFSSLGFGKAAGRSCWEHRRAKHIQGICKSCSSHPWKRHKDLNLLFFLASSGCPVTLVFRGMNQPGFVTH